jgi:hypothetical protein
MCTELLPPSVNPIAVNKYINIINISRAEVKNYWSYTTAPPICLMAWTGTAVPSPLIEPLIKAALKMEELENVVNVYQNDIGSAFGGGPLRIDNQMRRVQKVLTSVF